MSVSKNTEKFPWIENNQGDLMQAIARIREALKRQITLRQKGEQQSQDVGEQGIENYPNNLSNQTVTALEKLCQIFGLAAFERDVLLLCAGMELDSSWGSMCASAQADQRQNYPTFSLALAALKEPNWNAIAPTAPLRRWQLIEVGVGNALTTSPLRIDERILHYIAGVTYLDERLMGMVEPVGFFGGSLVESHRQLAQQLAATWWQTSEPSSLPIVQLCGDEIASKRAIAAAACNLLGLNLNAISAHTIPTNINELHQVMQLWKREAILDQSALLLDCDEINTSDSVRENAIAQLIERITSPLIITSRDRRASKQRPLVTFDIYRPTNEEQRTIWNYALGEKTSNLNGLVDSLVSQFNLSSPAIHAACAKAMGRLQDGEQDSNSQLNTLLWDTCRTQARPQLDDLAQHIKSVATWDELVLPEIQRQILRDISSHVRQRSKVYENWGFAGKGGRGLGISALFAGASGTGKTMAAEVLAGELRLDLYRIDLSSVVSKYIGETEKNLRRVFDAAEAGGAILLFDEADALFGKRSEVKDSHDRHANIEVSYLLQRMEAYQGLAILTTNLKSSLDQAFLRRIRFVVQFPFPDGNQREEIWKRVFPKQTPTDGLEADKLGQLSVTGGNIRNIALNAAFLAADAGEPVTMQHILRAAKSEYTKLERPLTDPEIKGWV